MVKRLDPAAEGGSKRDKRKEMAEVLLPDLPRVRRKDPKIVEAGMGSARKAAVEAARKLMQKMKGSKKTSKTGADKATEKLSKTKVPPSKLSKAEKAAASDLMKYGRMQDEVIDLIHGTGPAGSKWKNMSTASRKQLFDDLTGMSYESYMKKYATKGSPKQPKDLLESLDEFSKAAID